MATGCSTSSSYNFTFNWSIGDFSKCSKTVVKSPSFSPPPPFNHISWRLWLHPNGLDPRSRGYLAVQLEMVNNESEIESDTGPQGQQLDNETKMNPSAVCDGKRVTRNGNRSSGRSNGNGRSNRPGSPMDTARPLTLTSASVIYKIGIINAANKMIDSCLEEEDFHLKPLSKVKLFMRNRLIMINCREAQSIMDDDILTLRCEVTYSESLLRQIVPSFDVSNFVRLLDEQKLTDVTIQVNEEEEDLMYEYDPDGLVHFGHSSIGSDHSSIGSDHSLDPVSSNIDHVKRNQSSGNHETITNQSHVIRNQSHVIRNQSHVNENNNTQSVEVKGREKKIGLESKAYLSNGDLATSNGKVASDKKSADGQVTSSGQVTRIEKLQIGANSTHAHSESVKEIKAHKVLLAARSPVFESMLTNGMIESSSNVIEVSDIDYEVMKEMIDFMYTGFVSNLSKYALDLLFAAEKYHLRGLKVICENYLKTHLNQDNVISILLAADLLSLNALKNNCIELICNKIKDMNKCNQTWINLLAKESPDLFKQIQLKCGS